MQFRAEVAEQEGWLLVRLAGRLDREQSAELVRLCYEVQKPVRIDLTDLVSVDAAGLETLRTLHSRGACLLRPSPYLALQLENVATRREEPKGVTAPTPAEAVVPRVSSTEDT